MSKGVAAVPYCTRSGNMLAYPDPGSEMRTNAPFTATLRIVDYIRGRSAARFVLEDKATGLTFPMFLTDMLNVLQHASIEKGVVSGRWIGCKRGQNYGLRLESQDGDD
ncbi:hypothetical protein [Nocardia testacea]|uniref:hypothetical protein n=1 Tax=Nocardia testacea TaxID=248551 RepID=UPI0003163A9A|nr:hypothetical protein [Nocardia testacea]